MGILLRLCRKQTSRGGSCKTEQQHHQPGGKRGTGSKEGIRNRREFRNGVNIYLIRDVRDTESRECFTDTRDKR